MKILRTNVEAKAWLRLVGISVIEFSRKNNLDAPTVYQVRAGRKKGYRGKAHQAAVALGMKPRIAMDVPGYLYEEEAFAD